jgi:hypothetical protein
MDRLKIMKRKRPWAGMLFLAVLLSGQEVWAEVYSVQIGAFQKVQNAQQRFKLLEKSLPPNLLDHLRIEKTRKAYVVKVGKLDDLEQAQTLLSALTPFSPDAFIWKGEFIKEQIHTLAADYPSTGEKVPSSFERRKYGSPGKPAISFPISQALLRGTIREINSLASEQMGLPPGKKIYRLIIWVEESEEIKGFPDFLREKENDLLTVFSETNPPFFQPGHKITAVAQYRGDRFSRFTWIINPQAVKP